MTRCRLGFTLVELLVVAGIVTVIVALLLPALSRARQSALRIVCQSNLRQIGNALIVYAQDNKGSFPAPSWFRVQLDEDWVHWQPNRDVTESRIFRYVGTQPEVLKCPAGVPERRETVDFGGRRYPPYPFSYSVNVLFTGYSNSKPFRPPDVVCRLQQAVNVSNKILAIEQDVTLIDDGAWWIDIRDTVGCPLSVRHDRGREITYKAPFDAEYSRAGRGNVVFLDGHCEFIERYKIGAGYYTNPWHRGGERD